MAGIHAHATRGNPESSPRYRDLLVPLDIPHELRAAFVIRGRVWGAVHVARRASSGPFQQQDANVLAAITGAVARGIRTSLRFDAARRINGLEAPGLVVLGPGDEVEMITPPARELLASIAANDVPYTDDDMPAAVLSLAGFGRSAPPGAQAVWRGPAVSRPRHAPRPLPAPSRPAFIPCSNPSSRGAILRFMASIRSRPARVSGSIRSAPY